MWPSLQPQPGSHLPVLAHLHDSANTPQTQLALSLVARLWGKFSLPLPQEPADTEQVKTPETPALPTCKVQTVVPAVVPRPHVDLWKVRDPPRPWARSVLSWGEVEGHSTRLFCVMLEVQPSFLGRAEGLGKKPYIARKRTGAQAVAN